MQFLKFFSPIVRILQYPFTLPPDQGIQGLFIQKYMKTNYYSHAYKISKQKLDQIRKNAKQRNKMKKKLHVFFSKSHSYICSHVKITLKLNDK